MRNSRHARDANCRPGLQIDPICKADLQTDRNSESGTRSGRFRREFNAAASRLPDSSVRTPYGMRKILFLQDRELVILDANARLFASLVIMAERNRASIRRRVNLLEQRLNSLAMKIPYRRA